MSREGRQRLDFYFPLVLPVPAIEIAQSRHLKKSLFCLFECVTLPLSTSTSPTSQSQEDLQQSPCVYLNIGWDLSSSLGLLHQCGALGE